MKDTLIDAVMAAYEEVDTSVDRFAKKSGLKCPVSCGRCCESPLIEATPLECLPLAQSLLPKASEWMPAITRHIEQKKKVPSSCPFYISIGFGNGFCSTYEERPLICRMFGFAAFINDGGEEQLDSCHLHTDLGTQLPPPDPDGTGTAKAPLYRDYKRRLRKLNPDWSQPLPVAEAVLKAMEILLSEPANNREYACPTL